MASATGHVLFTFGDFRSRIQLAPLSHLYIFFHFPRENDFRDRNSTVDLPFVEILKTTIYLISTMQWIFKLIFRSYSSYFLKATRDWRRLH